MNNYSWTSDDVRKVEKFIEIKNRGYYIQGKDVTDVYNRILNKNVATTNCGSCIKQRICELEKALNSFKNQMSLSGFTDVHQFINEINAIEDELNIGDKIANVGDNVAKSEDNIGNTKSVAKTNKPKGRSKTKK